LIEKPSFATFPFVHIGAQVWMTENLNVDTFRNGEPIPHAQTAEEWMQAGLNKQPAWCYYDNNPANGEKFGKLYNWYAVNDSRGLAPDGWHVPTDEEWTELTKYLGGNNEVGFKLKSSNGWKSWLLGLKKGNGSNVCGFNALPGGYRKSIGDFFYIGCDGGWWSSSEDSSCSSWFRTLFYGDGNVGRDLSNQENGFSIRCIKN
jgi:uncharacterized protein (TIGR02145 family)